MSSSRAQGAPSLGWMLWMSAWMLSTVIPGAMFSWLGFLIIGILGRMKRWIVVGVLLGAAAMLVALPIWGQWQSLAAAIVYLGGMLLALAANPSWLRAMWARAQGRAESSAPVMARPQTRQQPTSARRKQRKPTPTPAPRPKPRVQPAAQQPKSEAAGLAERAGASTAEYFAAPAERAAPVDVNEADAKTLAGLPGLSRSSARQLIKQRDKHGGFASLEAFATAANLQPHELARLRDAAVCSPPARGPRQFGRRVDY